MTTEKPAACILVILLFMPIANFFDHDAHLTIEIDSAQ